MPCNCKCCCGCCCDGSTGSQTLYNQCEDPKVFHGKGTLCDVCCDLGEIREDITAEEDCPGTWVVNGRCQENPCGCSGSCDEENPCPEGCYCLDGQCVAATACCIWSCDYIAEILWPDIENPEDVPDISDAMIDAGWVLVAGAWRKTIKGEENCDDAEVAAAKSQDLQDEVDAIVSGQGGYSTVTIDGDSSGAACIDGLTQQECEAESGFFHAGAECGDGIGGYAVCEPNPLP